MSSGQTTAEESKRAVAGRKPLATTQSEVCFVLFAAKGELPVKVDDMFVIQVETRGGAGMRDDQSSSRL